MLVWVGECICMVSMLLGRFHEVLVLVALGVRGDCCVGRLCLGGHRRMSLHFLLLLGSIKSDSVLMQAHFDRFAFHLEQGFRVSDLVTSVV